MEKVGFIFPGQGAQAPGMGKDFFDEFEEARRVYSQANEIVGFDLAEVCFNGPADTLNSTVVSQPAILTTSLAILAVLRSRYGFDGIEASALGGLSLGEFTALASSGALGEKDAIRLVHRRGSFMQECCDNYAGTMAAVMGMNEEKIDSLCRRAGEHGVISIANLNCPGQIVVSGAKEAVKSLVEMVQESSARVVQLQVAGAFHSELMKEAGRKLESELANVDVKSPLAPVVANVDGEFSRTPAEIKVKLIRQVSSPVLWQKCMEKMISIGVSQFYEIGPGKVLAGLGRRINRDVRITSINSVNSLEKALV